MPQNIYHVYNQGNNKETIFHQRSDYLTFLSLTRTLFAPVCDILSYCIMPNHFHFMIYSDDRCIPLQQGGITIDSITNAVRKLLSGYARIYNKKYNHSGSVFRQKTKAKCLSDSEITVSSAHSVKDYLYTCFHYIHQNPLKASLVTKLEDWEFSSFKDYANIRDGNLMNKKLAEEFSLYDAARFIDESYLAINEDLIKNVLL